VYTMNIQVTLENILRVLSWER